MKLGDTEPVEYLSIGPIFATTSKLRPDPVVGIAGLKSAARSDEEAVLRDRRDHAGEHERSVCGEGGFGGGDLRISAGKI